jgi:hypothetical protein
VRFFSRALRLGTQIAVVAGGVAAASCGGSVNTTPVATFGSFTAPPVNGLSVAFNVAPGAPSGTTATATSSAIAPAGVLAPSSIERRPEAIAGAVPFFFVSITLSQPVPAALFVSEVLTLTNTFPTSANYAVEVDDPSLTPPKLTTITGTLSNGVVTFPNSAASGGSGIQTLAANHPYVFQFYYIPGPATAPGAVVLSPASLAFTAAGAASAQSVSATQASYGGSFTASTTTCSGIATISPASGSAFTVTPVAAGACTFIISGGGSQSTSLAVGVTTTGVGGS